MFSFQGFNNISLFNEKSYVFLRLIQYRCVFGHVGMLGLFPSHIGSGQLFVNTGLKFTESLVSVCINIRRKGEV